MTILLAFALAISIVNLTAWGMSGVKQSPEWLRSRIEFKRDRWIPSLNTAIALSTAPRLFHAPDLLVGVALLAAAPALVIALLDLRSRGLQRSNKL
jgi:hypothetical protein